MKVEYLSSETMNSMHKNGETVRMYNPPYSDMPRNFAQKERTIFSKLKKELDAVFREEETYVSFETWADLVIRLYVDVEILSKDLEEQLIEFMRDKAPDHYLSCTIQDLVLDEWTIYGFFGVNNQRFLVDKNLKSLWQQRVGEEIEWPQWQV